MKLLKGTFFLKVGALFVAMMTYFYVQSEIQNAERKDQASDPSYKLIRLTAKSLPVKIRLETVPPEGYRISEDKVTVKPSRITVIGPEALLEEAQTAETAIIDVSDNTKTVVKNIPIETVAGVHIAGQPYLLEVTVPIEKIPEPEPPPAEVAPPAAEKQAEPSSSTPPQNP